MVGQRVVASHAGPRGLGAESSARGPGRLRRARHRAALGLAGHHHLARSHPSDAQLRRALWQLLVGGTVAAALASTLAFVFGRRIAGAVGSLVRIARAVERGQRAQPLNTGVTEVNTLAEQPRAAADRARKRERGGAPRASTRRARISAVAHALNASPDLDAVLRAAVGSPQPRAGRQRPHRARGGGWPRSPLFDSGVDRTRPRAS